MNTQSFKTVQGGEVEGRKYSIQHHPDKRHFRIVVEGVMHPAGKLPIRFKTIDRAASHLRTMGLSR